LANSPDDSFVRLRADKLLPFLALRNLVVDRAIVNGRIRLHEARRSSVGFRELNNYREETMAKAGSGIGTHREGRQQRTRQAKQPGAKAAGSKKQSAKAAVEKTLRRRGKTRKHVSEDT
jgi:hypothetical protein